MSTAASGAGNGRMVEAAGCSWEASIISHGRSSAYLNVRVHRPIVEFRCTSRRAPRRYAPLPAEVAGLADMDDSALTALWTRARVH